MRSFLSRAYMALAGACLGDSRREWALAMQAEFESIREDGRSLHFAAGCLISAWRTMPTHDEGRFMLANYAFATLLIVPLAGLLLSGTLLGFPFLYPGPAGIDARLAGEGLEALLNDANRTVSPVLAFVSFLLAIGHLLVAWTLLERDWARVAVLARLNAAITATLVIFTGIVFLDESRMLLPILGLAGELTAVLAAARWGARLPPVGEEPMAFT